MKRQAKRAKKVTVLSKTRCKVISRSRNRLSSLAKKPAKKKAAAKAGPRDHVLERFERGQSIADFINFSRGRRELIP